MRKRLHRSLHNHQTQMLIVGSHSPQRAHAAKNEETYVNMNLPCSEAIATSLGVILEGLNEQTL